MSMRRLLHRGGLFALCWLALAAHAWGPVGHHAVGGIADRLLDDQARAQVAALLDGDLDKDGQLSGRTTLESVATWADEIRSTSANRPQRHFDDIPACGDIPDPPDWCGSNDECASRQIELQRAILADDSRPHQERNEALKWLVHLVGDIHQPLHAATNIYEGEQTDDKGNPTDRGGNDVGVALPGAGNRAHKELHGVWDNDFVNLAFGRAATSKTSLSPAVLDTLAGQAGRLPDAVLGGSALDWALQSNGLARTVAYHFDGFACFEPVADTVTLDDAYVRMAKRLVPKQIVLAGARLARLLNTTLGR